MKLAKKQVFFLLIFGLFFSCYPEKGKDARPSLATNDTLPATTTPDEFDRETGQPYKYRIRPRPSKAEMWRVYEK